MINVLKELPIEERFKKKILHDIEYILSMNVPCESLDAAIQKAAKSNCKNHIIRDDFER